jgi:fumarylacetoacetate (FAA) hydrolase
MKLATLKDGTRDGQLAIVSRDLKTAHLADGIAPTLQAALDDWTFIAPQLNALYQQINQGRARRGFEFEPNNCMAPLPRAFQRVAACACSGQGEQGADAPGPDPLMYQAASDDFLGPGDAIVVAHEAWGIDFDAGLAVITGDVPMACTPDQAQLHIKLLMLVNSVALRKLMAPELAAGFGLLQFSPGASCAPLALTPDELGDAWMDGKVHLALRSTLNGKLVGQTEAGAGMAFNFPQLLAHLTKTRGARAGTIVGSGTLANGDRGGGYSCIAEKRRQEMIADGVAGTPYMLFEDRIKIEMLGADGKSLFGAIDQLVKQKTR